jgi:peroxiredoxin
MTPLMAGEMAPDFELPGALRERKQKFKLSDYRERKHVVLAFYPLGVTPT